MSEGGKSEVCSLLITAVEVDHTLSPVQIGCVQVKEQPIVALKRLDEVVQLPHSSSGWQHIVLKEKDKWSLMLSLHANDKPKSTIGQQSD